MLGRFAWVVYWACSGLAVLVALFGVYLVAQNGQAQYERDSQTFLVTTPRSGQHRVSGPGTPEQAVEFLKQTLAKQRDDAAKGGDLLAAIEASGLPNEADYDQPWPVTHGGSFRPAVRAAFEFTSLLDLALALFAASLVWLFGRAALYVLAAR